MSCLNLTVTSCLGNPVHVHARISNPVYRAVLACAQRRQRRERREEEQGLEFCFFVSYSVTYQREFPFFLLFMCFLLSPSVFLRILFFSYRYTCFIRGP